MLEDQLSHAQQAKSALSEARKQEAAELKDSIRQFEQEEVQKWQQRKQQQAKVKQMYSQQVTHSCCETVVVPLFADCFSILNIAQ